MQKTKQFKPLQAVCPCCAGVAEVLKPPRYEVWDSLTSCPHCGVMLFKIATHWKAKLHKLPDNPAARSGRSGGAA